jgi:hypothetical protein
VRIEVHAHYRTDAYLDMLVDLGTTDTATQRGHRSWTRRGDGRRVTADGPGGRRHAGAVDCTATAYADDAARAIAAACFVNDAARKILEFNAMQLFDIKPR